LATLIVIFIIICIYYSYRYAWWKATVDYGHPRILMYHMITDHKAGSKFNGLRVSPQMFEQQLKHLTQGGWTFFTISELVDQKGALPPKSIAITFDDGYEDNFKNALPILKKYNAKATIYLVVDRHDREWSSKRKAKNSSGELMREPKLHNAQIIEMIASELIEIGSHTMTHDNLSKISVAQKEDEIYKSKELIEQEFNINCSAFCYPFGIMNKDDWALVQDAGYFNATTVEKGIDDINEANPYLLKRITISGKDNFYAFKLKLKTGKRGVKK